MTPYETTLKRLMAEDERVVALTAENRAPLRTLVHGLQHRFIDTGITEQTMVGAAAGLALQGRRPIAHGLAAFLTMRAFEFIRTDIGIPGLPVILVGYIAGILSDGNGPTHQAIEDVSLMRGIPGMQVFCPSDRTELASGLELALASGKPTYIRWIDRPGVLPPAPFTWGKSHPVTDGNDVSLLTYGALTTEAWEATQILKSQGIAVRLIHLRTLVPLDEPQILRAVRSTALTVTLEDHFLTGGLFTVLCEILTRNQVPADVLPLGFDGTWFRPALLDEALEHEGLTGPAIADRILRKLESRRHHV